MIAFDFVVRGMEDTTLADDGATNHLTTKRTSINPQTGTGYSYDNNGNPTTYNSTTLGFDPENRLTSYGSALTVGYRGDGLRAWKQTSAGRTYFLYDGSVPVVEIDSTGTITATTIFGANSLTSRPAGTASIFYTF